MHPPERSPLLDNSQPDFEHAQANQSGSGEENGQDQWAHVTWWRKPSVFWLLLPYTLYTMAHGAVIVPRLNIILTLLCRDYFVDKNLEKAMIFPLTGGGDPDAQCRIPEIQALVSRFALYLSLLAGVLSAITSPMLGAFSDRHGRRPILALSSVGLLAFAGSTIIAVKYPDVFSVNILLVGALIEGLSGNFMLGLAVARSYAADCTSIKKRAISFGYFQGALFLGIAVGPALGGTIIKHTGNVLVVFYCALVANGFFLLYLALLLPESLSTQNMQQAQERYKLHRQSLTQDTSRIQWIHQGWQLQRWNPFEPLQILVPRGPGSSPGLRKNLIVLATIDTLIIGVAMGAMTVVIIYAELMFSWGNYESGMYLSIINFTRVILLFIVMPAALGLLRGRGHKVESAAVKSQSTPHPGADTVDIIIIRLSMLAEFAGYMVNALANNGPQFTVGGIFMALGGVGSPTIQSALTKHVPRDRIGQLLGAQSLLHSLAQIISPTIFNLIYAATVGSFPQTVFVCLASVFLLAALCTFFISPHVKLHEDENGNMVDSHREGGEHINSEHLPS